MSCRRLITAALSLALVFQGPGFAGYQAFAAEIKTEGGVAPENLSLPTLNTPVSGPGSISLPALNANVLSEGVQDGSLPLAAAASPASAQATATQTVSAQAAATKTAATASASVQALTQNPNVKAAVDTEHASGQAPALDKVYEGVGPKGADRAVFTGAEGQIMKMNYQPAVRLAKPAPRKEDGRTPVHVLVGGGGMYGRGWSHDWAKESAAEIGAHEIPGMKQVVLDGEKYRPAGAEHFIPVDLTDMSEANKKAVAEKVIDYLEKHNMVAVGANTFLQGYIRMGSVVQEAVSRQNNPAIPVNPLAAVESTVDKLATRMAVGELISGLKWPAASPGTIADPDIEAKAIKTFHELKKQTPSGKVVLKLATAAGKAGLRVAGIETDEQMVEAIRSVIKEINEDWKDPEQRRIYIEDTKNGPPKFLIEGYIDRLAEMDVELGMSVLPDGTLDVLGSIIGNPNPGNLEKGYLFGMDGLMTRELQRAFILAATEAVVATWHKFGALPFGNFHVEMIVRGDPNNPGKALVEINGPRPIGGNGVRLAKEWHSEFNLIKNGLRGAVGLPQLAPKAQPADSLLALGITPAVSGTVTKIESTPAELATGKGFAEFGKDDAVTKKTQGPIFLQLSEVGEHVHGADSAHPGGLGAMVGRGQDAPAAVKNVIGALAKTGYEITKEDGTVRAQKGSEEHSELDYRALPSDKPHLTEKAAHELDAYEEAQLRWTPIFKVYYPLFSALMNAMGGLAAIGIGRIGYTAALFVSTPFASVLASHLPVKKVLKYTWAARIGIWALLIPAAVLLFPAGAVAFTIPVLGWGVTSLQLAILGLNFLDGLMVSLSHTVDMDAGGMDMVAKQNGFQDQMTPEVRKHYGTRYMAWASKAQFIFPLGIAVAVAAATTFALPITWAFLAGMAGVFLIQGGRAILSLNKMNGDVAMTQAEHGVWKEFTGGVAMVKNDRKLLGLVTLETLERSIGDALFMVAFPMLGLFAIKPALHLDEAGANLAATILMSIMSYAGMKASQRARKNWKAPEKDAAEYPAYKPLFKQMFVASTALLSIPAAYYLIAAGLTIPGVAVAALGAVGFMMAFKKAQIGAMNMFQTAAGEHEGSTRIFGIASAVSMLFSGFAVWGLENLFSYLSTGMAFLSLGAFFLAIGAAYWAIWPRLASKSSKALEKKP